MGGRSSQQTTQSTDHWNQTRQNPYAPTQPHIRNVLGQARGVMRDPDIARLPGQRIDLAAQGLGQTARGGFLGANPYLDQMIADAGREAGQAYRENILPQISGGFARGGRYGSGAHTVARQRAGEAIGDDLARYATGLYGQQYGDERDRMMRAQALLPGVAQAGQAAAYAPFGQYANLIGQYGQLGGTTTSHGTGGQMATQPGGSPIGQAFGGGLAGAGTGAMIGSMIPGVGTAAGAAGGLLLGGLGGLFG